MTRETKFGLLLVLTLTSVFGFLVWKKMHQPNDLIATTQSPEVAPDAGETPPEQLNPPANEGPIATPLAAIPTERPSPRRPVTPIESTSNGDELFPVQKPTATAARPKPKLPVDLDGQEFFAAPKSPARAAAVTETRTVSTEPDPFAAPVETSVRAAATPVPEQVDPFANQAEPATNSATVEPDPFATSLPVTSQAEQTLKVETAATSAREPDPFAGEAIEVPSRQPVVIEMPAETTESVAIEVPQERVMVLPSEVAAPPARRMEFEAERPAADTINNSERFNNVAAETPVEVSARSSAPVTRVAERAEVAEPVIELPARTEPVAVQKLAAQEPNPFFVEESRPEPIRAVPERQPPPRLRAAPPMSEPDPFGAPAAVPNIPMRAESFPVRAEPFSPRTEQAPVRREAFPARDEPLPIRATPEPFRTTARPGAPVALSGETYLVQPNDNFWSISKKVYGSGRYFEALAKYNANVVTDPTKMKPGLKIATPTANELQARYPQLLAAAGTQDVVQDPQSLGLPGDIYVAHSGDNFWEISKRLYGDGKYFRALEQHNSVIVNDPQKLKPGMKLAAPKAAWLHAKYPQLVGSAAPAVQELRRAQPDRYQPDEPAGFFVGPGQQPMYRVGTRDTLSEIAQSYLGRSSRWIQIYQMNRDVLTDGNALNVGTVLKLPADASRVVLIEDGSLRR